MKNQNSEGNNGKKPGEFGRIANLSSVGIALVLCTLIGWGIGRFLDTRLGTSPWLMLVFLLLGIGAGFLNVFRTIDKNID
jgi:ATP synthase protein I